MMRMTIMVANIMVILATVGLYATLLPSTAEAHAPPAAIESFHLASPHHLNNLMKPKSSLLVDKFPHFAAPDEEGNRALSDYSSDFCDFTSGTGAYDLYMDVLSGGCNLFHYAEQRALNLSGNTSDDWGTGVLWQTEYNAICKASEFALSFIDYIDDIAYADNDCSDLGAVSLLEGYHYCWIAPSYNSTFCGMSWPNLQAFIDFYTSDCGNLLDFAWNASFLQYDGFCNTEDFKDFLEDESGSYWTNNDCADLSDSAFDMLLDYAQDSISTYIGYDVEDSYICSGECWDDYKENIYNATLEGCNDTAWKADPFDMLEWCNFTSYSDYQDILTQKAFVSEEAAAGCLSNEYLDETLSCLFEFYWYGLCDHTMAPTAAPTESSDSTDSTDDTETLTGGAAKFAPTSAIHSATVFSILLYVAVLR
mmetsp:Transcript_105708/g.242082  ORF Transcript_105708/g.242082 Transcript_105708/m.242082 type:complete len:422 (+) Transcript_105708:22-1287(+)